MERSSYFSSARIAFIAVFGCLAGVLYILNFTMPFAFPGFLEFNFADIPALIGSFALGPLSGTIIVVVRILIKLVFKGTSTAFVGELSDLITGCMFVIPAGLIYTKRRTFKGALLGMLVGTVSEVAVALLVNWLILIPFFAKAYGWAAIVGFMQPLFPSCTEENFYSYYLWISALPFNLMRCIVAVAVTLPVYKRISGVINKFAAKFTPTGDGSEAKAKKINVAAIISLIAAVILLIAAALIRYFVFNL